MYEAATVVKTSPETRTTCCGAETRTSVRARALAAIARAGCTYRWKRRRRRRRDAQLPVQDNRAHPLTHERIMFVSPRVCLACKYVYVYYILYVRAYNVFSGRSPRGHCVAVEWRCFRPDCLRAGEKKKGRNSPTVVVVVASG